MRRLAIFIFMLATTAFGQLNTNTANVTWSLRDFGFNPENVNKLTVAPLTGFVVTNGNLTNIFIPRPVSTVTSPTGIAVISNLLTGISYRVTVYETTDDGKQYSESFTNGFPTNLQGNINAAGYIGAIPGLPFIYTNVTGAGGTTVANSNATLIISSPTNFGAANAITNIISGNTNTATVTIVSNTATITVIGGGGGSTSNLLSTSVVLASAISVFSKTVSLAWTPTNALATVFRPTNGNLNLFATVTNVTASNVSGTLSGVTDSTNYVVQLLIQ